MWLKRADDGASEKDDMDEKAHELGNHLAHFGIFRVCQN